MENLSNLLLKIKRQNPGLAFEGLYYRNGKQKYNRISQGTGYYEHSFSGSKEVVGEVKNCSGTFDFNETSKTNVQKLSE